MANKIIDGFEVIEPDSNPKIVDGFEVIEPKEEFPSSSPESPKGDPSGGGSIPPPVFTFKDDGFDVTEPKEDRPLVRAEKLFEQIKELNAGKKGSLSTLGVATEGRPTFETPERFDPVKGLKDAMAGLDQGMFRTPGEALSNVRLFHPDPRDVFGTKEQQEGQISEERLEFNKVLEDFQKQEDDLVKQANLPPEMAKMIQRLAAREGVRTKIRDLQDVNKHTLENLEERAPIAGSILAAKNEGLVDLVVIGTRLESDPDSVTDKELLQMKSYIDEMSRDSTFWASVADTVYEIPGFAIELFATGGIATAAKKGVEKTARKTIEKYLSESGRAAVEKIIKDRSLTVGLGSKIVAGSVGELARLIPASSGRITKNTLERIIPEVQFQETDENKLIAQVNKPGDDIYVALAKAGATSLVENLSEQSGQAINILGKAAKDKVARMAIFKGLMKANPDKTPSQLIQVLQKAGWNGMMSEMLEERIGELGRSVVGVEEYTPPTLEQIAVELVSFSVPGAGIAIAEARNQRRGQQENDLSNIADKISKTVPKVEQKKEEISDKPIEVETVDFSDKVAEAKEKIKNAPEKDQDLPPDPNKGMAPFESTTEEFDKTEQLVRTYQNILAEDIKADGTLKTKGRRRARTISRSDREAIQRSMTEALDRVERITQNPRIEKSKRAELAEPLINFIETAEVMLNDERVPWTKARKRKPSVASPTPQEASKSSVETGAISKLHKDIRESIEKTGEVPESEKGTVIGERWKAAKEAGQTADDFIKTLDPEVSPTPAAETSSIRLVRKNAEGEVLESTEIQSNEFDAVVAAMSERKQSKERIDVIDPTGFVYPVQGEELSSESLNKQREERRLQIEDTVAEAIGGFSVKPNIQVFRNISETDIPIKEAPNNILMEALNYNGVTYLFSDRISDVTRVPKLIAHEIVVHQGLKKTLDADTYNRVMDSVFNDMDQVTKERLAQAAGFNDFQGMVNTYSEIAGIDIETPQGKREIAEELVALIAEDMVDRPASQRPNWLRSVITDIKLALQRLFPNLKFSESDLIEIIRRSARTIQESEVNPNTNADDFIRASLKGFTPIGENDANFPNQFALQINYNNPNVIPFDVQVRGLNRSHALEKAYSKWPGADIAYIEQTEDANSNPTNQKSELEEEVVGVIPEGVEKNVTYEEADGIQVHFGRMKLDDLVRKQESVEQRAIQRYRRQFDNGEAVPRIRVAHTWEGNVVQDGNHRFEAAKLAEGVDEIDVEFYDFERYRFDGEGNINLQRWENLQQVVRIIDYHEKNSKRYTQGKEQAQEGQDTTGVSTEGTEALSGQEPRFSLKLAKSDRFKGWFGDWELANSEASKVVDEQGRPLIVYRGDYRADSVNSIFVVQDLDSGTLYFTDNPELSSSFAQGKGYTIDTLDSRYPDIWKAGNKIFYKNLGLLLTPLDNNQIESHVLSLSERSENGLQFSGIKGETIIPKSTWDYELKQSKGDYLKAAEETLINTATIEPEEFGEFLEKAGVVQKMLHIDPSAPNSVVTPVYLDIKNPLRTEELTEEMLNKLAASAGEKDDNIQQLRKLISGKRDTVDETITYITQEFRNALENFGFDGIEDVGGLITEGDKHRVFIAFKPEQMMSAITGSFFLQEEQSNAVEPKAQIATEAFQNWFGDSKVLNDDGTPKIVYHGTTHDFWSFREDNLNVGSDMGKAYYFTDSFDDAQSNYAGEGSDLANRIEQRADRLEQELEDSIEAVGVEETLNNFDLRRQQFTEDTMKLARIVAKQELSGGNQRLVKAFLRIENPVTVVEGSGTVFEREMEYNTEDYEAEAREEIRQEEYGDDAAQFAQDMQDPSHKQEFEDLVKQRAEEKADENGDFEEGGSMVQLWEAFQSVAPTYNADGQELFNAIGFEDFITAHEMMDRVKKSDASLDIRDENGDLAIGEFFKDVFDEMGYDGMIFRDVNERFPNMSIPSGTSHYVTWNSTSIKSATDNNGAFDSNNDDIRFSLKPLDKPYLAAVERGDMAEAQSFVDEGAKMAGYDIGPVHHGTSELFFSFIPDKRGGVTKANSAKQAFFFVDDPKISDQYADLALEEGGEEKRIVKAYLKGSLKEVDHEGKGYEERKFSEELRKAKAEGYTGIIFKNTNDSVLRPNIIGSKDLGETQIEVSPNKRSRFYTFVHRDRQELVARAELMPSNNKIRVDYGAGISRLFDSWQKAEQDVEEVKRRQYKPEPIYEEISHSVYAVFDSNQIKSADPVTYDDEGNVIPLSERFSDSDDIRFSLKPVPQSPAWQANFPRVPVMTTFEKLQRTGRETREDLKNGKSQAYINAKGGDENAAYDIVLSLMNKDQRRKLQTFAEKFPDAKLAYIMAEEEGGKNALPGAFAGFSGMMTKLPVKSFKQVSGTNGDDVSIEQKMLNPGVFDGEVEEGRKYILLDDYISTGTTLSSLRHYIESEGGSVVSAMTLAAKPNAQGSLPTQISISPSTVAKLNNKFDENQLDEILTEYGIAKSTRHLTEAGGRYIVGLESLESLRGELAKKEGRSSGSENKIVVQGETSQILEDANKSHLENRIDVSEADTATDIARKEELRKNLNKWTVRKQQEISDDLKGLEVVEQFLNNGQAFDASQSAWKMALMTRNLPQVLNQIFDKGMVFYDAEAGLFRVREDGIALKSIFDPLNEKGKLEKWENYAKARSAVERAEAKFDTRWVDLPDGIVQATFGFSKEQAQEWFLQGSEDADVVAAWGQWQTFNGHMRELLLQTGLITQEFKDTLDGFLNYVPFYRDMEEVYDDVMFNNPKSRGKKGIEGQSSGIKKFKGSKKKVRPILENIFSQISFFTDSAYKNIAMQRAISFMEEAQLAEPVENRGQVAEVSAAEVARKLEALGSNVQMSDAARRETISVFQPYSPDKPNEVSVTVDGKKKYYKVEDNLMLEAVKSIGPENLNIAMKVLMGARSLITRFITSTPEFAIANYLRDTLQSWVLLNKGYNPLPYFEESAKGVMKAFLNTKDVTAIGAAGAGGSFYRELTPKSVKGELKGAKKGWRPWRPLGRAWRGYEKILNAFEQANRIAVFNRIKATGGTDAEAAFQAMDVLNFGMKGGGGFVRFLIRVTPFLNARIQGLYKIGREIGKEENAKNKTKIITKEILARGSMITLATIALWARNNWDEDEDGELWYRKLTEQDKLLYYHFRIPGTNRIQRIPKPFEIGALFSTIPEMALNKMWGDDTWSDTLEQTVKMITDIFAFDPRNNPVIKIPTEQISDRSLFWNTPIVGYLNKKDPVDQVKDTTSLTAKELGKLLKDIPTDDISKQIPVVGPIAGAGLTVMQSPVRFDAAMQSLLGGFSRYLLNATDVVVSNITGEHREPALRLENEMAANIFDPVYNRFFKESDTMTNKWFEEYYDLRSELDQTYSHIRELFRQGELEAAEELLDDKDTQLKITARELTNEIGKRLTLVREKRRLNKERETTRKRKVDKENELLRERQNLMELSEKVVAYMKEGDVNEQVLEDVVKKIKKESSTVKKAREAFESGESSLEDLEEAIRDFGL